MGNPDFAMPENPSKPETFLKDQAIVWLGKRLPRGWGVKGVEISMGGTGAPPTDSTIVLESRNGPSTTIVVEERESLSPRGALGLLPPLAQATRRLAGNVPLLVVAP